MTDMSVLTVPLESNDAGAKTVIDYIILLGLQVLKEDEGFSGKRPFGNSGWSCEILDPVVDAGLAEDSDAAERLVCQALEEFVSL